MARRLKVLMSAYACEPGKGSEPGVGWNLAVHMARFHDVWVLTRANNRPAIEAELERNPVENLHFCYHDLPGWARFWKRGPRGVQPYYYLWQLTACRVVRALHQQVGFDLAHHVTFVKYWAPACVAFLNVPFIWGPVGGADSAPLAFWTGFGLRGIAYESLRVLALQSAEFDPLLRRTARTAAIALCTTPETARRARLLGAKDVRLFPQVGLSTEELDRFQASGPAKSAGIRFVAIGRLLHWKGQHLGLIGFAKAALGQAEYWLIGDGVERQRLRQLANKLGIANSVRFWGQVPRNQTFQLLSESDVLIHPSLHDSGGFVCAEAMAAGKPVICLDLGGPAVQVTDECGFKVPARSPDETIQLLAQAMRRLYHEPELRLRMGAAARERARTEFNWARKAERLNELYQEVVPQSR